jgi:hypothetical protein
MILIPRDLNMAANIHMNNIVEWLKPILLLIMFILSCTLYTSTQDFENWIYFGHHVQRRIWTYSAEPDENSYVSLTEYVPFNGPNWVGSFHISINDGKRYSFPKCCEYQIYPRGCTICNRIFISLTHHIETSSTQTRVRTS